MTIRDVLTGWKEPEAVRAWADKVSPRPQSAWLDYINYYIHPDVVAVVGRFLIPAFVEHDGGVFLRDQFTLAIYSEWKLQLREVAAIEKAMNHRHVYDLFAIEQGVQEDSLQAVANLMAQALRLALLGSFPERHFEVYVSSGEHDYGPTVGFYSIGTVSVF